ncbi:MAG: hypothetical protein ABGZ24_22350, partial [Fuerstiella sp.]
MYWKRSVQVFLLGSGLSVFGVGCAAVDAVVNSPAGNAATNASPQRMAAIGRMFENQGRLAQAQMMYRKALRAEPGNLVARERLEHIAALKSERVFDSTTRSTRQAIAVADSLKPAGQVSKPLAATPETAEQLIIAATDDAGDITAVALASGIVNDSVIDLASTAATTTDNVSTTTFANQELATVADSPIVAAPLSVATETETETETVTVTVIEAVIEAETETVIENESEDAVLGMEFAPAAKVHVADMPATLAPIREIATVGYEGQGSHKINSVSLAAEWTAADRVVTVEQVASWMEVPQEHSDELFTALQHGESNGVKALAAMLLTD